MKFDDANPWKNAAEKYAVGNVVTGKVARMTDFGAFVELEPESMLFFMYPRSQKNMWTSLPMFLRQGKKSMPRLLISMKKTRKSA